MTNKKKYECRFAYYSRAKGPQGRGDVHVIKEAIHNEDGTIAPNLRIVKDYKRKFWVTKKGMQNHKSKKEWELLSNLNEFESTQSELQWAAAKALGQPWFKGSMRDLQASPYLYGTDIDSVALIKQSYRDKNPELVTPYSVAVFDTETDVIRGTNEITMATISFKSKVFTAVQKSFVAKYNNPVERIKHLCQVHLGEVFAKRAIELEVLIVDSEIDVVKQTMMKAHEWKPDILAVWNILFDMEKIIQACDRAGVSIEDILNDPKIPQEYRSFFFKIGPAKKITASGVVHVFKPAQRWHSVNSPASFYWIDAMCAYHKIRQGSQEEPSYALDAILQKHLGITKLKFTEADGLKGLDWHKFMQEHYPLEYVVYNIFDCISMEMLDEKTNDLQLSLPMYSGCSDFARFNSQPRRTVDALHNYVLKYGLAIASTAGEMKDADDDDTATLSDWIVMLPSHLVTDSGLCLIEENPNLRTNIRIGTSDLDVAASYPTGEVVCNISKETTRKELISVEGIDETLKRMNTINFSAGHVNAVEFCTSMFGMPELDTLLAAYSAQNNIPPQG